MAATRRILKWVFVPVLSLLAVLVAAWALSRALYPTETQREAIAQMERLPEFEGDNAFALLWTLDRAVPDDELANVMAQDVRTVAERPRFPDPDEVEDWGIDSAADRYPDLGLSADDKALICSSGEQNCLARVRADLDAYGAMLDRNRALFDRIEKLAIYDHLRSEFPHLMSAALPSFQSASYLRTRHAFRFVQGQVQEALAGACRSISTWRRLGANSDMLIARLVGADYATDVYGRVFTNMLAELPAGTPLPLACSDALAPPTVADWSLCNAMQGEFAMSADITRSLPATTSEDDYSTSLVWTFLFDADATVGMTAESMRTVCTASERKEPLADQHAQTELEQLGTWGFACLANPIGCTTHSVTLPSYLPYNSRMQDYAEKLRALGTLTWMRRNIGNGQSPAGLLADRPDNLKSPSRDITLGPEGRTLCVARQKSSPCGYWSVPLPPDLQSRRDRRTASDSE